MSTFKGRLKEDKLKFICLDNFEKYNLDAEAFFLSHFHYDHMHGLSEKEFREYLIQEDEVYLYCSKVTRLIILAQNYNFPAKKVIGIDVGKPFVFSSRSTGVVAQVELIATGHCPGAVMFLIEHDDETILYTGDFRINPEDVSKIKIFEKCSKLEKQITSLYLDTQFAFPEYLIFPSRQDSVDIIVRHINHWLQMDEINTVGIERTAKYGLEGIIGAVSKRLGMRILVEMELYETLYKYVEEFLPYITTDQVLSKVHVCYWKKCSFCRNSSNCKVIRPCAMSFKTKDLLKNNWKEPSAGDFVRVPYATHSSLEELISFVNYIRPKTIYANVIPNGTTEDEILSHLNIDISRLKKEYLDGCIESVFNSESKSTVDGESAKDPCGGDSTRLETKKNVLKVESRDCDDLGLISPPRKRKKSDF